MTTKRRIAQAAPRLWTRPFTVANTWAQNDTVTFTIDNIDVVITIGTLVTTAQVATTIKQAFNDETLTDTAASVAPANLGTGLGGAQAIAQFRELVATVSGSVVTLTAVTTDKDITITVAENTAGSGTCTAGTEVTATGPRHFNDDDNWQANGTPADSSDIVLDIGNVNLDQGLSTGIQPTSLSIPLSFTGNVGLPEVNVDAPSYPYHDYRTNKLTFNNGVGTPGTCDLGKGKGAGSKLIRLDYGAGGCTWNVFGSSRQRLDTAVPVILLAGTNTANILNNFNGDVGLAFYAGEACNLATLNHGSGSRTNAQTWCGAGAVLTACTIKIDGGSITFNSALCTTSGNIQLISGTATHLSGNIGTGGSGLSIFDGGTWLQQAGGTINTLAIYSGGTFDKSQSGAALTVTNAITMYPGSTLLDPFGSLAANTKFYFPEGTDGVKLVLGNGHTLNKDS